MTRQPHGPEGHFLTKAEEYLASAEANLAAERLTPCAGDAIHAGISAKDAIVSALSGGTVKSKDHRQAAKELTQALGWRPETAGAERALRELIGEKAVVEYGTTFVTPTKAAALVRRARFLVELAHDIVVLRR